MSVQIVAVIANTLQVRKDPAIVYSSASKVDEIRLVLFCPGPRPSLPPPSLLLQYPGPGALLAAAVGLLHIQSHYNLSIPSLLQGRLVPGAGQVAPGAGQVVPGGGQVGPGGGKLDAGDVRLVARGAAQLGRLDLELAWLQQLLGAGQEVEQSRWGDTPPGQC